MASQTPSPSPSPSSVKCLPKVELHAHLSGSISQAFLSSQAASFRTVDVVSSRSLAKCFEYFEGVRRVITDLASLTEATRHVFREYAAENTIYLELRTTPKRFLVGGKEESSDEFDYVAAIRDVAAEFVAQELEVKLLLSVDRGKLRSPGDAVEAVAKLEALARRFPDFVVGLDVSGDPRAKTAAWILEALTGTLPTTFHCAEIPDDDEARAIVKQLDAKNIRRLGHVCSLPKDVTLPAGLGVELCPTSNLVAMQLDRLDDHHFPRYFTNGLQDALVSVNCDDRGLFNCSLTSEIVDLAAAFDLSLDDLIDLQRQAITSSFHPDPEALRRRFEDRLLKLQHTD
mmetsp:Transcript_498/g.1773  ORF Transcript_498/g.1773 Transcript_498/m.1773 type:complete len:343 (-) Transcript_498:25-1053(-)